MRNLALVTLQNHGFDLSQKAGTYYYPHCSQCEACVINGLACHETGCPNETRECRGCYSTIPARQQWCEECR